MCATVVWCRPHGCPPALSPALPSSVLSLLVPTPPGLCLCGVPAAVESRVRPVSPSSARCHIPGSFHSCHATLSFGRLGRAECTASSVGDINISPRASSTLFGAFPRGQHARLGAAEAERKKKTPVSSEAGLLPAGECLTLPVPNVSAWLANARGDLTEPKHLLGHYFIFK